MPGGRSALREALGSWDPRSVRRGSVDARTRKLAGWLIAAIGAVIAIVGVFADSLGLGGEGPDEFGAKQVAALVVGVVIVGAGLALTLLPLGQKRPPTG
jgi:hypothetical protein